MPGSTISMSPRVDLIVVYKVDASVAPETPPRLNVGEQALPSAGRRGEIRQRPGQPSSYPVVSAIQPSCWLAGDVRRGHSRRRAARSIACSAVRCAPVPGPLPSSLPCRNGSRITAI